MSICLNGFILSVVIIGIYVTALHHYLGVVFLSDILSLKNPGGGSLGETLIMVNTNEDILYMFYDI